MSMTERGYKSIGEVLGLLLEEFPNVTISKIRFLESQGLIEPERTPSGYRKFTDAEIERLRYILREQETNYLPLRVIRDRLDESGSIPRDPTAPTNLPPALRNQTVGDVSRELARIHKLNPPSLGGDGIDESVEIEIDPVVLAESERLHPAARRAVPKPTTQAPAAVPTSASTICLCASSVAISAAMPSKSMPCCSVSSCSADNPSPRLAISWMSDAISCRNL